MKSTKSIPTEKPQTCFQQIATYAELRAILPPTEKKCVPGVSQLKATATVILHAKVQFGILEVYDNGFYTYSDGEYISVIAVDRCSTLRDDDSPEDVFTVPIEEYDPLPWQKALECAGIYALSNNTACREKAKVSMYLDDPASTNNMVFSTPPEHETLNVQEEEMIWRRTRNRQIRAEYKKLLPRQKKIIQLVCFARMNQTDVAKLFDVDQTAISHSLSGIKAHFKKFL